MKKNEYKITNKTGIKIKNNNKNNQVKSKFGSAQH